MTHPIPLRRFLTMQFSITATIPAVLTIFLVWLFLVPQFCTSVTAHQQILARMIAGHLSAHLPGGERQPVSPDQLSSINHAMPKHEGIFVMFLDRSGRVVADSHKTNLGQHFGSASLPSQSESGEGAFRSGGFEMGGEKLWGTLVEIEGLDWKVLVAQPVQSAFHLQRLVLMTIFGGLVAALTLAMVMIWFRAGTLAKVFRLYANRAQSIARGDYDFQLPRARTLEFDNLSLSLQHMAGMIDQREKTLMESETRLRITLDSIGDGVITTDANGLVTRMNPMAEQLTGWPLEEAQGRNLDEVFCLVNARTRETVASPAEKVLKSGQTVGLANPTMLIGKDGRKYQIADSGAPIRHPDGHIIGVVLVFRDVTEAYAREEKIRENEKRLSTITANVPGAVFQFHADEKSYAIEFISDGAADIFGISSASEDFFDDFLSCIPEDEKEQFLDSVGNAVDQVAPWCYEGRFTRPDGESIWFSGNSTVQKSGGRTMAYGVLMDITERRQLEASLHLSQFIFQKAAIGIFRIDDQARILDANDQACRSLGYTKEGLCSQRVFDIDPDFDPEIWPAHIARLRKDRSRAIESRHRKKNGDTFPVQIFINLIEFHGQEFHVAFVQDITQHKEAEKEARRLEEALLQSQKMEAIGTLAGGIAHDFNNILSAVIGYSELALPETTPDGSLRRSLERIHGAGLRAKDLVQQILTFSRKAERHLHPLQAGPLVKEALKLLRSTLPATIEMASDIAGELDPVLADPIQIHQIVMNLCTNAAQAMEDSGGRIRVGLSQIRLSDRDIRLHPGLMPGDYLRLTVQDTGPGIPSEIMPKIFDPYFTTKERGKGTGLGMAVVHGIVKNYGGAIYAYSEPGSGTTFNLYIPTVEAPAGEAPVPDSHLPGGREHLLLVDDEPVLVDVGRQLLERLGYRISTADGSQEAFDIFRKSPDDFDLVLTDMTMPGMTGDRLAETLMGIRPDLPIILTTGFSSKMTAKKAREIGIRALIYKPVVESELAQTIRGVLDGLPVALGPAMGRSRQDENRRI